jgi:hypothetical protein
MATIPTVAEARAWLKIPHDGDDTALANALRAAESEWTAATGRTAPTITDAERMAMLERVGNLVGYRGDDAVAPSSWYFDTVRRMFNPNAVG